MTRRSRTVACAVAVAVLAHGGLCSGSPVADPLNVTTRFLGAVTSPAVWPLFIYTDAGYKAMSYGGAIMGEGINAAVATFGNTSNAGAAAAIQHASSLVDGALDGLVADPLSTPYALLHGRTVPFDAAVGDHTGLFPVLYLSRYLRAPAAPTAAADLKLASVVASQYVFRFPRRLPDGTYSRAAGWSGEVGDGNSFLWADDQYMGFVLLLRMAVHFHNTTYVDALATMAQHYAGYMRDDTDGLLAHGYNHADGHVSCCKWGRANGWTGLSYLELLAAMDAFPGHPQRAAVLQLFQGHAAAMLHAQSVDGRWHQVVNDTSTFLETSVTAMTVTMWAEGIRRGWLPVGTYTAPLQRAWAALAHTVAANGTVSGICDGTDIQTSVSGYQARPTAFLRSGPGGAGTVLLAAAAVRRLGLSTGKVARGRRLPRPRPQP